jgi:hypothetical protein
MLIPVHIKEAGNKPPEETHYIVAKNGLFLKKMMSWAEVTVPVETIETLENEKPEAILLLPDLPVEILVKAVKFSKLVYDTLQSEVGFLLHHGNGGYELTVPQQHVNAVSINYEAAERIDGALLVGTIHSHGGISAFHSQTDLNDEETFDGIHITIGDIDKYPLFSLSSELAINGKRFKLDTSWFEGLKENDGLFEISQPQWDTCEIPLRWVDQVHLKKVFEPYQRRRRE